MLFELAGIVSPNKSPIVDARVYANSLVYRHIDQMLSTSQSRVVSRNKPLFDSLSFDNSVMMTDVVVVGLQRHRETQQLAHSRF